MYNELEKQIRIKCNTKKNATEWLITLINKHVKPIGGLTSLDLKLEAITTLANKAFLEQGVKDKECVDWTKQDIIEYIATEVNPYISDEYGILNSQDDDEVKQHLEFYIEKYPPGKEKERAAALKEVALSEIPRTDFVKKVMRKIRKGDMSQVNEFIRQINTETNKETK